MRHLHIARKFLIALCGVVFLAVGLVGIAIPILPGLPFLIIGACCFASISEVVRMKLKGWHTDYRQRHLRTSDYELSFVESIQLKLWQWTAGLLRWLSN